MTPPRLLFFTGPRLLAGFSTLTLLAGLSLFASRPAHTAGGPIAVSVANTVQNQDSDNPARQPIQFSLQAFSDTSSYAVASITVPAGKRLVIEYYLAQSQYIPVGGYALASLSTEVGGQTNFYEVVPVGTSTLPYSQMVRLYADPGTQVTVTASTGKNGATSPTACDAYVNFSGYYVDVP